MNKQMSGLYRKSDDETDFMKKGELIYLPMSRSARRNAMLRHHIISQLLL
jgi:hypothetical protein